MSKEVFRRSVGFYQAHPRTTDYTGEEINPLTGEVVRLPTMTKQEFISECDINNIIREYTATGNIAHVNARAAQGVFADLPASMDFQESIAVVESARAAFAQLPSRVRDRFGNDPQGFLDFVENPDNQAELVTLGLAQASPLPSGEGGAGGVGGQRPEPTASGPESPAKPV